MLFNRSQKLKASGLATDASANKGNGSACRSGRFLLISLLSAILLVLVGASGAWAETYTSGDTKYPVRFYNDIFDGCHNDLEYMDSVYFGGKEIVFFMMQSSICGNSESGHWFS
jgi:ABC-type arginine transport system permease subunit